MYDIGIVTRENDSQWGGDLRALFTIRDGMKELGLSVKTGQTANHLRDCRFTFISNTCLDQTKNIEALRSDKRSYGLIGFHEDFLTYFSKMMGFTRAVKAIVENPDSQQLNIDVLESVPDIIGYFIQPPPTIQLINQHVLRHSALCVANSKFEERTMLRDCPTAKTCAVHWTTGSSDLWHDVPDDDSFLKLTGVEKHGYILQIGRMETRKNQLMTVIAARDLGLPIVFVATRGYQPWYVDIFKKLCKQLDVEVILVAEEYHTQTNGKFKVIAMPGNKKLPLNILKSAINNCTVCVGPAYHELPGYTYLEALHLGCPVVSSEWTSCKEYLQYKKGDGYCGGLINYCVPWNVNDVKSKIKQMIDSKPKRVQPSNKIFNRVPRDVAKEIVDELTV